jgi:hypothetical protein
MGNHFLEYVMRIGSIFPVCVGALFTLMILAGCDNSKSSPKPSAPPPATPSTPEPAATKNPAPAQNSAALSSPATPAKAEPTQPLVQETPAIPPASSLESSDEEKREQASGLIYAQIRVKMEDFIDERAKLLKNGTDPADPKVRQLEGQIMRARQLLTDNGEVVEDVEPPIVQKATAP